MSEGPLQHSNAMFYQALETLDLPLMEQIWSHAAGVRCIHPGWDVLEGWPKVRHSFEQIFAGTAWLRVALTGIDVVEFGEVGVVVCCENITTTHEGAVSVAVALATNLFRRESGDWKLLLHHASLAPLHLNQPFGGTAQ